MKKSWTLLVVCGITGLILVGCAKEKEPEAPESPRETGIDAREELKQLQETAGEEAKDLEKSVEDMRTDVEEGTEALRDEAVEAGQSAFDAAVEEINKLVAAKNYQAAMTRIKEALALPNLTDDQQNILQALMDQIQQAMADETMEETEEKAGDMLKGLGK